jgi:hypothetical protein
MLTEKDIEKYLKDKVKKAGGIAYKFISPGNNAVPDRLVCLPWTAQIFFVETKAPGKKPAPQQRARHRELRRLNQVVFGKIDSKEDVDTFMDIIQRRAPLTGGMIKDLEMVDIKDFDTIDEEKRYEIYAI